MDRTSYQGLEPKQIGQAIRAFRADECPACGGEKMHIANPFCLKCITRLTPVLATAVADRSTFIVAFHPAMNYLKAEK